MSYVDKYPPGSFSNSMLDAWEQCPYKAHVLYEKRAKLVETFDRVLDSLSLGIGVHEVLEKHSSKEIEFPWLSAIALLPETAKYEGFFSDYNTALQATHNDGKKWGKTYSAPTWTSFWKKNFAHLDAQKLNINDNLKRQNNWLCDIDPLDFVTRAQTCFANYNKLLCQINITENPLIEESFKLDYDGRVVVGTMDRVDYADSGCLVISDFKTGNKQYDERTVQNLNQLNLYKLKLDPEDQMYTRFRIISLERGEIIEAEYDQEAGRKYAQRLKRQLKYAAMMREVPLEDLPVAAGKSMAMGCPCVLARVENEFKCTLY